MPSFKSFLTELNLTIQYHNMLNPALWHDGALNDGDTNFLLQQAKEFIKFSDIDPDRVSDIVVTGSNANYNYTKFSDIDVHVMCDESGLDAEQIYRKKVQWANAHKELKLDGYPVEMYIQDATEHWPAGQGVYSLVQRKWIVQPVHLGTIDILKDPKTTAKVEHNIIRIHDLLQTTNVKDILDFKEKMWKGRSAGLERAGEFSLENIVYKDLRNRGLIDMLNNHLYDLQHPK